jgi:hypothetical protein
MKKRSEPDPRAEAIMAQTPVHKSVRRVPRGRGVMNRPAIDAPVQRSPGWLTQHPMGGNAKFVRPAEAEQAEA